MFLRQLQLIVAALTFSLSAISSYLYHFTLLKGIAVFGLLWSTYACYKIFTFNVNSDLSSETVIDKEEPKASQVEIVSQDRSEVFQHTRDAPHNINKEPKVPIKKEPILSKNLKQSSEI